MISGKLGVKGGEEEEKVEVANAENCKSEIARVS